MDREKEHLNHEKEYREAMTLLFHCHGHTVINHLELHSTYTSAHSCDLKLWLQRTLVWLKLLTEA